MTKDKNARFEQESWTQLRPICHPSSFWQIRHSIQVGLYAVRCAECGQSAFQLTIETK